MLGFVLSRDHYYSKVFYRFTSSLARGSELSKRKISVSYASYIVIEEDPIPAQIFPPAGAI